MLMSNTLNNYVMVSINSSTNSGGSRTPSFGVEKKCPMLIYSLSDSFVHYTINYEIVLSFRYCEMSFIYYIIFILLHSGALGYSGFSL